MTNLIELQKANAQRWARAKSTRNVVTIAKRLSAPTAKARYMTVSQKTGVPWPMIAVIHERECSQDWTRSLAQGDFWNRVSVHVPAGRGPFRSWEAAAIDALENCAPYAGRNNDWSIGALLTKLEEYNGLGYAARGTPSPYVWAGTDQYRSGKYVRDGVYDPNVVDSQAGCAGLLMAIKALDPAIAFIGDAPSSNATKSRSPVSKTKEPTSSKATLPAKWSAVTSIVTVLASAIVSIFAVFKPKGK
jgi:lysozyme family protein